MYAIWWYASTVRASVIITTVKLKVLRGGPVRMAGGRISWRGIVMECIVAKEERRRSKVWSMGIGIPSSMKLGFLRICLNPSTMDKLL